MLKIMKNLKEKVDYTWCRTKCILANEKGDFYISDGIKIIIAVVLGALLLSALTFIFKDTVIPRLISEIEVLFS